MIYSDKDEEYYEGREHFNYFQNRSMNEDNENGDESFHKEQHYLHFGDFKDDRAIFKNPVESSQYNLIERPTYLLQFN